MIRRYLRVFTMIKIFVLAHFRDYIDEKVKKSFQLIVCCVYISEHLDIFSMIKKFSFNICIHLEIDI